MSLIRWYRTRNLPTVWDQMEQMAREMSRLIPWQEEGEDRPFGIPVNVYETDKEVVVKAELPGVKKEDLDVNIQDNTLTIRAQTREESEVKEESYLRRERRMGSFSRTITLPVEVNPEKARAHYRHGLLEIHLPKSEEARPRPIRINLE